jgi:16S rRNA (guanine966-N2)-methyltransferase
LTGQWQARIIVHMKPGTSHSQLRIIGGAWRGRKIDFAAVPGLRPTPNRIRETLFNWLAPVIRDSYCLDLFAGSGALGLEAASRGAACCVLVERDAAAVSMLRAQASRLAASQVEVIEADAVRWLSGTPRRFDIVFLDPPFHGGLLQECANRLEQHGWLKDSAWIYVEAEAGNALELPPHWHWHRDRQAGQVSYRLARRQVASDS